MSRVRGRNTRPELYVRRAVWAAGFRYRLHVKKLPGKPDIVLTKYRLAVSFTVAFGIITVALETGDRPLIGEYWDRKLDGNAARDARHRSQLQEMGWTVVIIWECSLEAATESLLADLKTVRADCALRTSQGN